MSRSFKDLGGNSLVLRAVYDAHCPHTYVGVCRIPTSYFVVTRRIVGFALEVIPVDRRCRLPEAVYSFDEFHATDSIHLHTHLVANRMLSHFQLFLPPKRWVFAESVSTLHTKIREHVLRFTENATNTPGTQRWKAKAAKISR